MIPSRPRTQLFGGASCRGTIEFFAIAPAGVGEATAIVQKIASIVHNGALPLNQLVVLTHTGKAQWKAPAVDATGSERTWDVIHALGISFLAPFPPLVIN